MDLWVGYDFDKVVYIFIMSEPIKYMKIVGDVLSLYQR